MPINDDLRDLVILHAHYLEGYKSTEVRRILALVRDADARLVETLQSSGLTEWNRARYQSLLDSVRVVESLSSIQIESAVSSSARELGEAEVRAIASMVGDAAGDVIDLSPYRWNIPAPSTIWAAAVSRPLTLNNSTAVLLEPFIRRIGQGRLRAIENSLRFSYAIGETLQEAVRRVVGTRRGGGALGPSRRSAEAITRTTYTHLSSQARRATNESNADLVRGYQWVSTLDAVTSATCQDFDGRVYVYREEDIQSGDQLLYAEVYPPAHPNCRSTTVPLLRSWEEMGIDPEKIPAGTRASATGQVPETTTYYQWLKRQPAAVQRDVLGATRYRMWKDGEISITSFTSRDGRLYTLRELAERGYTIPPRSVVRAR